MVRQAWEFDTELKPIQVCGGKKIPDRKAVIRTDTGSVLGIVGDGYRIVPHSKVIDTFDRVGFLQRKSVDVCKNGAVLFSQYDFANGLDIKSAEVQVGDVVNFGLRVFNSYNSVFGVGFEINALQLRCKNGLVIPKTVSRLSFKHFQNIDVSKFKELITGKSAEINGSVDVWRQWLKIRPSEERIQAFFEDVGVGERLKKELLPKAIDESKREGVWGVFSVMTHYVTHDMKVRGDGQNRMLSVRNKEREILHKFYDYQWSSN